jgi:uncharacterized membrane protein
MGVSARGTLPWLFLLYLVASLVHFSHNAEYLSQYPNLPATWTRTEVYLAWCGVTLVGVLGYALYVRGTATAGRWLLAAYALCGFAGLLHYTRAPLGHHTAAMNGTIWAEVVTAAALLLNVLALGRNRAAPG